MKLKQAMRASACDANRRRSSSSHSMVAKKLSDTAWCGRLRATHRRDNVIATHSHLGQNASRNRSSAMGTFHQIPAPSLTHPATVSSLGHADARSSTPCVVGSRVTTKVGIHCLTCVN
jgi:hypothetical protein